MSNLYLFSRGGRMMRIFTYYDKDHARFLLCLAPIHTQEANNDSKKCKHNVADEFCAPRLEHRDAINDEETDDKEQFLFDKHDKYLTKLVTHSSRKDGDCFFIWQRILKYLVC